MSVSEALYTYPYPYPNTTLTLTCYHSTGFGLGRGRYAVAELLTSRGKQAKKLRSSFNFYLLPF